MNRAEKTKIAAALVDAADVLLDSDKSRANKILLKAIGLAKNPMAKEWLRDGRASGTWIRTAADLLERSAAKAAELGLTEDQVDEEVATMMAWMALSTILRDAKRGSGLLTAAKSMDDVLGYGSRGWKTMKDDARETLIGNQRLQALREQLSFPGIPGSDPEAEADAAQKALERLLLRKGAQLQKQAEKASRQAAPPPPIDASSLMRHRGGDYADKDPLTVALTEAALPEHEVAEIAKRFASVELAPPGTEAYTFRNKDRHNGKRILTTFQPKSSAKDLSLKLDERGRDPVTDEPVPSVLAAILARLRVKTLSEALDLIAAIDEDGEGVDFLPEDISFFGPSDGNEEDDINAGILYARAPHFIHLLDDQAMLKALKPLVAEAQDRGTKLKEQIELLFKKLRIKPDFKRDVVMFSTASVPKVQALGVPVESWRNGGRAKLTDLAAYFAKNPIEAPAAKPKRKTKAALDAVRAAIEEAADLLAS